MCIFETPPRRALRRTASGEWPSFPHCITGGLNWPAPRHRKGRFLFPVFGRAIGRLRHVNPKFRHQVKFRHNLFWLKWPQGTVNTPKTALTGNLRPRSPPVAYLAALWCTQPGGCCQGALLRGERRVKSTFWTKPVTIMNALGRAQSAAF